MDPWTREIAEQICIGIVLEESKLESGNRLALICVDNGVEVALKLYVCYNNLLRDKDLDSPQGFFLALDKIKDLNKIDDKDAKDIRQFHKIRNDLYHRAKLTTVRDGVINAYLKLAKMLLDKLYDFRPSELEWKKLANGTRKSLVKEKIELREPVEYGAKEVEGAHLVSMKTPGKLKNTESIILVIHGFITSYARSPTKDELKKSLMISGRDISDDVLDARIYELRKAGYLESKLLKLKGKAITRLRKKFLI